MNDDLTELAGVIEEPVPVTIGNQIFHLTSFVPSDYIASAQYLRTMREQRAIGPTGYLRNIPDNDLRAKVLKELAATPITEADVLIDSESSYKMMERASVRAGFTGNWQQFIEGLTADEARDLQTKALRLAGLGKFKESDGASPLGVPTSTPSPKEDATGAR